MKKRKNLTPPPPPIYPTHPTHQIFLYFKHRGHLAIESNSSVCIYVGSSEYVLCLHMQCKSFTGVDMNLGQHFKS